MGLIQAKRQSNLFEKILALVGIGVSIGGFYLIARVSSLSGGILSVDVVIAALLWLMLILLLIVAAIAENAREDLGVIISHSIEEIKLLRQINQDQLEETKLQRHLLETMRKK